MKQFILQKILTMQYQRLLNLRDNSEDRKINTGHLIIKNRFTLSCFVKLDTPLSPL